MAENIENNGCLQRDNAEHEGYVKASRSFNRIWKYEKRSTILTTNINFNSWDDAFYDPVIANAILDRILHHAHVINITGKSYRLREYMIQDDE